MENINDYVVSKTERIKNKDKKDDNEDQVESKSCESHEGHHHTSLSFSMGIFSSLKGNPEKNPE